MRSDQVVIQSLPDVSRTSSPGKLAKATPSVRLVDQSIAASAVEAASAPSILPAAFLIVALIVCTVYANLALAVTDGANFRFFPPFQRHVNANQNKHLGAEYLNIARALVKGQGFANPWGEPTGPTAWMPPVLPTLLAGLLWLGEGDITFVMTAIVALQVLALITTGLLVLAVAWDVGRANCWLTGLVFLLAVLLNFRLWFQFTHDYWLILLALDVLLAWFAWGRPLGNRKRAAAWGVFAGICAMVNPIVALAWGGLSAGSAVRRKAWTPLACAILAASLTLAPWTVRNYLVFGRWIPVKSNLAYELYQSQCLQRDGLLQAGTFGSHPYCSPGWERQEYRRLGEMAFLDSKRDAFWKSVAADPLDFRERVASRFWGATMWYVPHNRAEIRERPWATWFSRLAHPLAFLGLLVLAYSTLVFPLHPVQWVVMSIYAIYLLPYVVISYYERYAAPLLGIQVLLILWGLVRLISLVRIWWRRYGTLPPGQVPW
jgi:hypothetical protein